MTVFKISQNRKLTSLLLLLSLYIQHTILSDSYLHNHNQN